MKKILFVSDFDLKGSGYLQVSIPLCVGLVDAGYEVTVIGMNYAGNEHYFPFTILPCVNFKDAQAMIHNLNFLDKPDVLIVVLDLPHQHFFLSRIQQLKLSYICITPLENPPLTMAWAAPLLNANGVFLISEMGKRSALDAGIMGAEHLEIGIDTSMWKQPTMDEQERVRENLGVNGKFVILTVADNQERKNLWAALEIIAKMKKDGVNNLKYFLITRENLTFGWRLRDLATELGINAELSIIERGIPFDQLWAFYAAADMFLLTSKAEGLGLPVLESMACGVPVISNKTGAIPELLGDGRGYLVEPAYRFRDVWGNAWRDMINIEAAANLLRELMGQDLSETVSKARAFAERRTWEKPIKQLINKIEEVTNEQ